MPDYGYLNARLRGMKTGLIHSGEYEKMLKASGIKGLQNILAHTRVKPYLEKSLIRYEGVGALEEAFKRDFIDACRKVMKISEGEQEKLVGIILKRWDVFNIKTVLRGKHGDIPTLDITSAIVPAGDLDDLALKEMAGQPGVKEVVDLLATWGYALAEPLVENLDGYLFDKNLIRLELGLDKAYFAAGLKATAGPMRNRRLVNDILRSEIDVTNIMAKIRLIIDDVETFVETKKEKAEREKREKKERKAQERKRKIEERNKLVKPKPPDVRLNRKSKDEAPSKVEKHPLPAMPAYFIPKGRELGGEQLVALLRVKSIGELLVLLEKTSFGKYISAEMTELETIPDLAAFERSMEVEVIKRLARLYRDEPMGIAAAISFLWMKYNEFVNLRIITRGKEFNIPENILRSELVYAF